jgi:imidazolonepropionase-like amidohydrolase
MYTFKVNFLFATFLLFNEILLAQAGTQHDNYLIIKNATVLPSPNDSVYNHSTIIIKNGKIFSISNAGSPIIKDAEIIDATGCFVVAGFWNSHVHFIESEWSGADTISKTRLENQLQQFLTRYGFDYVFDIGSDLQNTLSIKQRIETKQIKGPNIFTTGMLLAPPGGQPVYLSFKLPELTSALSAKKIVTKAIDSGADAIKIYSGSIVSNSGRIVYMPAATIQAVTATAHNFNKLVFAHPQTDSGVVLAVQNGVDIIAHTTLHKIWSDSLINEMVAKHISLTPTLKLYDFLMAQQHLPDSVINELMKPPLLELGKFLKMGGQVLFGTDVGYMSDYDPGKEYIYMQKAGLSFRQILATLTTAPASRFARGLTTGRIQKNMDADLIVLSASPFDNIENLTRVLYTIKHGEIIYRK